MMQPERDLSQTPDLREQYRSMGGLLAFICQALEASVAVFLRRNFGRRYFGRQAAAVLLIVPLWSLGWEGHDPRPLWVFLGLYVLGCLWARLATAWRVWRGHDQEHSYYCGTPGVLFWRLFRGRLSEMQAKGTVEPICVFVIGLLLMPQSEPLGAYLMVAAFGVAASTNIARAYEEKRLLDMRDTFLSQRAFAERFRKGGW